MPIERDAERPKRRRDLLELDVHDLLRAPGLGEHMLRELNDDWAVVRRYMTIENPLWGAERIRGEFTRG